MEQQRKHQDSILARYPRWIFFSIIIGLLAGTAAAIFLTLLTLATDYRELHPWLVWLLPIAGLVIGLTYHYYGSNAGGGTGLILEELHRPNKILPFRMAPLVLLGTVLTHLFGGSAGREGTAVQMGASLADQLPTFFKIDLSERRILLVAGCGAGFSAAIGAPFAGAIFGLEVMQIGRLQYFAIVECLIASFVAFYTCRGLGAPHTHYPGVTIGALTIGQIVSVVAAAILFGLAANGFMRLTHLVELVQKRFLSYTPLRPLAAVIVLMLLFQIAGMFRYEGLGLSAIIDAFSLPAGVKDPFLKAGFTALTIGSGFKGGEFIPLVFIGSTLGSFLSTLLPVSMSLLAALGFSAVFGAAANTPIACAVMATEIFGWQIAPYAFLCCWIAYHFTGHDGIYTNQKVGRSKVDQLKLVFKLPKLFKRALLVSLMLASPKAIAQMQMGDAQAKPGANECGQMEIWDYAMAMCMPYAMPAMPMTMLMAHGNVFFTGITEERPRGRDGFAVPNMFMVDYGSSVGDRQYVNLDLMGTFEKWTFPENGYPELLQIGEEKQDGSPYLDAQHPHSSPIMGLTLSDTIAIGTEKDAIKVWFAPRGESGDGPVAFMHRPTGVVNPDAPLGHHIGQDVGHISSTVVGASIRLSDTTVELSDFHGAEPEPSHVDLPLGTPDSYAARVIQQFTLNDFAMASAAYVKNPEPRDPTLDHVWRYSVSVYDEHLISDGCKFTNALIWGLINGYDHASALNSFAEEFVFHKSSHRIWSRIEELQRTPSELGVATTGDPLAGLWVTAATLGYTQSVANWDDVEIAVGGSFTKAFLPGDFQSAYGGNPFTAKVFLQLSGMKMLPL